MTILDRLARTELLVVTGKGGVGKSAVAATLARSLCARERRTLLIEVDPRETVHQMLGVPPSGGERVQVAESLDLQRLTPRQVVDQLVREKVGVGAVVKRILGSPIYSHFVDGAPGLKEMAVLGYALRQLGGLEGEERQADLVVLDAPATGHGVSMLAAPVLVAEVMGEGPLGRMAHELAGFVSDQERVGVVVVTLAEEMPVQEALELREMLQARLRREPELLVVNSLYPPTEGGKKDEAGGDSLLQLWRQRRRINEQQLRRLDRSWEGARLELPLLPLDRGPGLIEGLQAFLDRGLQEERS